jgi:aryl-alcohol dehydrogenase-like predicted oxidoreductase
MRKILLKQINKEVSVLGLGTMIFSPKKKDLAFSLMDTFIEGGGNLIDTAEVYGVPEEHGYSEEIIGMWLKDRNNREDIIIQTKGCIPGTCKPIHPPDGIDISPTGIKRAIEGSLKRLKIDYIDIWMLHGDDPSVTVDILVNVLNDEIEKENILSYGVSNWNINRIQEGIDYARKNNLKEIIVSSPHFSLAVAKEPYWPNAIVTREKELNWHRKTQLPLVAWSSQGRGFFSYGDPNNTKDENLVRVYYSDENFERLNRAKELANKKGAKAIEIALAYVINQDFPTIALAGPASIVELNSCIKGANLVLSNDEVKWLNLLK